VRLRSSGRWAGSNLVPWAVNARRDAVRPSRVTLNDLVDTASRAADVTVMCQVAFAGTLTGRPPSTMVRAIPSFANGQRVARSSRDGATVTAACGNRPDHHPSGMGRAVCAPRHGRHAAIKTAEESMPPPSQIMNPRTTDRIGGPPIRGGSRTDDYHHHWYCSLLAIARRHRPTICGWIRGRRCGDSPPWAVGTHPPNPLRP
jgi:hypothetical protein